VKNNNSDGLKTKS